MRNTTTPKVNIGREIQAMKATIPAMIAEGNTESIKMLREKIDFIGKAYGEMRKSFDDSLAAAQSGYNGADFLAEIQPMRKPRESKGEKAPKSIFDSADLFD